MALRKVAFIGTHGVGKTTLCLEVTGRLRREGADADMVKEVARLSPLPLNRQTSLAAQTWILMTQVAEEIRAGARHALVVCDRSVLDNYAYLVLACGRRPSLEPFLKEWLTSYDLLFKVPVVGAAPADGVRDVDPAFVRAVDVCVDRLLADFEIGYETLPETTRDTWVEAVCERILSRMHSGES